MSYVTGGGRVARGRDLVFCRNQVLLPHSQFDDPLPFGQVFEVGDAVCLRMTTVLESVHMDMTTDPSAGAINALLYVETSHDGQGGWYQVLEAFLGNDVRQDYTNGQWRSLPAASFSSCGGLDRYVRVALYSLYAALPGEPDPDFPVGSESMTVTITGEAI